MCDIIGKLITPQEDKVSPLILQLVVQFTIASKLINPPLFTYFLAKLTRPSVRVHWVACGTCTVPDNFFQVGGSLRSHTRRGPLAHRSSHVRTTKQTCPCVICSSNSARYCFGIVYHCSAMVEVLCK